MSGYVEREALEVVRWDEGGRVHNWRNHVGDRTRAIWDSLSPEAKVAIALDADDRADAEEWD